MAKIVLKNVKKSQKKLKKSQKMSTKSQKIVEIMSKKVKDS